LRLPDHPSGQKTQPADLFPRQIQAVEAGGWLSADAKKLLIPTKKVAPLGIGRNRGSGSPDNEDGATIECVQRLYRSFSAGKMQGPRSRFNVRY
jgi:hypothetical protein